MRFSDQLPPTIGCPLKSTMAVEWADLCGEDRAGPEKLPNAGNSIDSHWLLQLDLSDVNGIPPHLDMLNERGLPRGWNEPVLNQNPAGGLI
jgi:hypothetical protein